MASSQNLHNYNGSIPRPNVQMLSECLKNGQLDLATAIRQVSLFLRETLKAIEDYAEEQSKQNHERKLRADKMDKLVNDLSEKCQGLQQALLYKEEKYDEKCREAERYKVICELSAKAAVDDNNEYYTPSGELNNNQIADGYNRIREHCDYKDNIVKIEMAQNEVSSEEFRRPKPNLKTHVKLSQSQMHLVDSIEPLQSMSPGANYEESQSNDYNDDNRSTMAQYYTGGPCKRKIPLVDRSRTPRTLESRTRERLEDIGGINVRGPMIKCGPVATDRLIYRPTGSVYNDDNNNRVKVDLTCQRNEMMSSSGDMAHQMKRKTVEKDLHKQVAGGCWTRLASRRKKDWPF